MPTVGIFGSPDDAEVSALVRRICARGAEPWVIDLASFPRSLRVVWREGSVLVEGRDTREMGSAYLRTVGRNLPSSARYGELCPAVPAEAWRSLYGPTLALLRQERVNQALRNTIIQGVARRSPVINPPIPQNLHRQKPLLFSRLVRAGVPVPPFLCTCLCGARLAKLERCCRQALRRYLQDDVVGRGQREEPSMGDAAGAAAAIHWWRYRALLRPSVSGRCRCAHRSRRDDRFFDEPDGHCLCRAHGGTAVHR
jgi:hypothetical protein